MKKFSVKKDFDINKAIDVLIELELIKEDDEK
jgi:hypothetical protein